MSVSDTRTRPAGVVRAMTIAGLTLLLGYVGSVLLIMTSPSDSAQRGAGHGALFADSWLTIVWVVAATALAMWRWSSTSMPFRAILAINAALACLLIAQFWSR
jgi:hypothetical protein